MRSWTGPLAVALAAIGCGSKTEQSERLTPRAFCEALQLEECTRAAACCGSGGFHFSPALCLKVVGRTCTDTWPPRYGFDSGAAAACARAAGQRYLGCGERRGDDPALLALKQTCAAVYPPALEEEEACFDHGECRGSGSQVGFCEGVEGDFSEPRPQDVSFLVPREWPAQAIGSPLQSLPEDAIPMVRPPPQHFCALGTQANRGQHCQPGLCAPGLFCSGDEVCVSRLPDGAACEAYEHCASGYCAWPGDNSTVNRICQPSARAEQIYSNGQCQALAALDGHGVTTDGTSNSERAWLAVGRELVYWIDGSTIRRVPVRGGASELVFVGDMGPRRPVQLLVDENFAYWASGSFLGRIPHARGTPALPDEIDLRAPGQSMGHDWLQMALDGDDLWLVTRGCDSIARFPKRFDQPLSLPRSMGEQAFVTAAAGRVYCGAGPTLTILEPATGARSAIETGPLIRHLAAEGDQVWVGASDDATRLWRVTITPSGPRAEVVATISPRLDLLLADPVRGRLYWTNDDGLWTSTTRELVPTRLLEVKGAALADDGADRVYWMVSSPFGWSATEGIAWLPKP